MILSLWLDLCDTRYWDVSHPLMGVAATPRRVAAGQVTVLLISGLPNISQNTIAASDNLRKNEKGFKGSLHLGNFSGNFFKLFGLSVLILFWRLLLRLFNIFFENFSAGILHNLFRKNILSKKFRPGKIRRKFPVRKPRPPCSTSRVRYPSGTPPGIPIFGVHSNLNPGS